MLLRLALRPDRALVVAVLGAAAAILLPVASSLVLAGVQAQTEPGWIAYPADPEGGLDLAGRSPRLAAAVAVDDEMRMAYVHGDPVVPRGERLAMPLAQVGEAMPRSNDTRPLLRDDAVLVHPDDLGPHRVVAAQFDRRPVMPDAVVASSRGADAFEVGTIGALREQGLWLILLSVPAVCMVSYAFARQEVRSQARRAATLSALGGHRVALAILVARVLLMAGGATALAAVLGALLYYQGPAGFHPEDAPRLRLGLALVLPGSAAAIAGVAAAWRRVARPESALRGPGRDVEDDVAVRFPLAWRPLLVGLRLFPVLLLAGALFLADVGFPAAAAQTPASLAGGPGEWVVGIEDGLALGEGVRAAPADVLGHDPRIGAIVAETIVPTLVGGHPVVLRGGDWAAVSAYHGLAIAEGRAPQDDEVALGERVARRHGWAVGDELPVQAATRAEVRFVRVSAIVDTEGPEADEGFVSEETGRALAGLARGEANVIRLRPGTAEARDAFLHTAPNLVVTGLAIEPATPRAGSVGTVVVDLANLGRTEGNRTVTARLNGEPFATREVVLAGHGQAQLRFPFVVPEGALEVEVNPTSSASASASDSRWVQEGPAIVGQPATFRFERGGVGADGVAAALYSSLEDAAGDERRLQEAVTSGGGRVRFEAGGPFVVASLEEPRTFLQGEALAPGGSVVVTHVWTVPGRVEPGTRGTLFGRIENHGTEAAAGEIPGFVDDLRLGAVPYQLAPGEAATVQFPLYFPLAASTAAIGERAIPLGWPGPGNGTGSSDADRPFVRSGEGIQTQVVSRVLGDAQQAMVALAVCALLSTLSVVYLATQRTLAGRRHVSGLLVALGQGPDRVRARAATEGAILGGLGLLAMVLPAKLAFGAMARWGPPVFAHALPDPIGVLFTLQAMAAFAGACGLAAYLASEDAPRPAR